MKHQKILLVSVIILAVIVVWAVAANNNHPKSTPTQASSDLNDESRSVEAAPTNHTILIVGDGFEPSTITINNGDSIEWKNVSGKTANVSSDPHPTHTAFPALNLGSIPDKTGRILKFNTTGEFHYHNHLDPKKTGTIVVD